MLQVFAQSGLNNQELASKLGVSNAVLSHLRSGRNKASLDLVTGLLMNFPDIHPDWLLFGKGEMRRSEAGDILRAMKKDLASRIRRVRNANKQVAEQLAELEESLNEDENG